MSKTPPYTLDKNLVLRHATKADADRLASFNGKWLSDDGPDSPERGLEISTRDLLQKPHPTFQPSDCTIVEDRGTGEIVSSIMLFPQTWTYAGIPFGIGRPELVATHPDHRRKGLVRAQMDYLHEKSAAYGHLMQAITGIPWFYRQFEYEMALDLGGGRIMFGANVPELTADEEEEHAIRKATPADIPFLADVYAHITAPFLFACPRDPSLWEYEITGRDPASGNKMIICIISTADGSPVGFCVHPARLWGNNLGMIMLGINKQNSWLEIMPAVMRYAWQTGQIYAKSEGKELKGVIFELGSKHPVYELFRKCLPKKIDPYAWYVRVPDIPGFLRHITPALEKRLERSYLPEYSGKVRLNFYRSGIEIEFSKGRIISVDPWMPMPDQRGDISFPDLTFLQLLCGSRSFAELSAFYPDCYTRKDEIRVLVETLFPKQGSEVWGVE